jgi:hemoglobin
MATHDSSASGAPVTDYDRIGGGAAVSIVVDRFYQRVLDDPQLAPFFRDTDIAKLKRHQVLLISQVLGGPANYDGRDLRQAHAGLQITREDFARVVDHLVASLREAGVGEDVIGRLGAELGGVERDVVTAEAR